jgi:hypothetical protein
MAEPIAVENGALEGPAPIDGLSSENGNSVAPEQPAVEPEYVSKGLYIVRIPRPAFDDTALKKLDLQLSDTFTKLKSMNNKAQTKRVSIQGAGWPVTKPGDSSRASCQPQVGLPIAWLGPGGVPGPALGC